MGLPEQQIRIIAGTPIEVGELRLLPSVLVKTSTRDQPNSGKFRVVKMRPTSVVVTSMKDTKWLEIPNTTMDMLSKMAGMGAAIAFVSLLIIAVVRLVKGQ